MPLDRLTHRYSKATPPIETPPINPLLSSRSFPALNGNGITDSPASPTPMAVNGTKRHHSSSNGHPPLQGITINENTADAHLLTADEIKLCQSLKIKPKPYMCIKERLIAEAVKNGGVVKEKAVKEICKVEGQRAKEIHEFFMKVGWIARA